VAQTPFAQLVSLACHDLRTPLATASGFASTLQRLDSLREPADRYIQMIGAAAEQMADLLDLLGAVARIEDGRFEPQLRPMSSRELADDAARRVPDGRASVEGNGAQVRTDAQWAAVSLALLAEGARRHGALERVTLEVDGPDVAVLPLALDAGRIALGDDLRDFGAAVGTRLLRSAGATVEVDGERLRIRLPQ
jgi:signal transduction histidine kinase